MSDVSRRPATTFKELTADFIEEAVVGLLAGRVALVGVVFFLALVMLDISYRRALAFSFMMAILYLFGLGSRRLEQLASLMFVCGAFYWLQLIKLESVVSTARSIIH